MTMSIDHIPDGASESSLPDGIWRVDPRHSEIGFAVKEMWGLRTVRGVFGAFDGSLEVLAGVAAGGLTIDAGSLATGNRMRDHHLRSPALLDVERHPRIVFAATAVTARDGGLTVNGVLLVGSSRVRLAIPVGVERTGEGELRLEGATTVSRDATGLAWNLLGVIRGDAVVDARISLQRATS
jgi:polyisoprenoid-binding protein YceI